MNGSEFSSTYFKFFAHLGELFQARFLRPLWQRYPSRETDDWEANCIFVAGYAFERQGAKPDYRHVATDVFKELAKQRKSITDVNTAQLAWELFRGYLNKSATKLTPKEKLNYANNPFCPQGTSYERKTGSSITYNKSIIEFLCDISKSELPPNIIALVKEALRLDLTRRVHNAIQEINGIGPKIASLFLRDVAVFYNIFPTKDRHLLQPVDVWIQRTFDKLTPQKTSNVQDIEKVQQWILAEATKESVSAEAVNQGIWYFSSQIADSDYRMSKTLDDLVYARALLEEYIEAIHQEAMAGENMMKEEMPCLK